jgi:hypothetical protein
MRQNLQVRISNVQGEELKTAQRYKAEQLSVECVINADELLQQGVLESRTGGNRAALRLRRQQTVQKRNGRAIPDRKKKNIKSIKI